MVRSTDCAGEVNTSRRGVNEICGGVNMFSTENGEGGDDDDDDRICTPSRQGGGG